VRWARWGREGREREVEKPAQSKKVGNIVWKVSRGQWVLGGYIGKGDSLGEEAGMVELAKCSRDRSIHHEHRK
jgi:hypothetical protein